ncbi:NAD(P)H-dependent oxidoreductase [Sanguibacter sp. HDW7]|uniref:NAD(P)H-dependent oxidoreductase n=1 Tax=Sanguibacter sp. HDW7 TaxID=2714931 RepID=UPI001409D892|nr:NAD(P)H-dependent oxidoreductase [Sanguibacter sp. HDW7]QIK82533.1 NAD(P)H-dependent oxidoreductase [Sanguibacter sp. HDW7]
MPRTLVVVGHPLPGSFTRALADAYVAGLRAGGEDRVTVLELATADLPHDPPARAALRAPDGATDHLEPGVAAMVDALEEAEHVVVLFPMWWGGPPAVLKAWADRVVLSGVAYRGGGAALPEKLLRGRTARIVMTMDSPRWWNQLVYRDSAVTQLSRATFWYTGVRTVGVDRLTVVKTSTPARREAWLARVASRGRRDATRGVAPGPVLDLARR